MIAAHSTSNLATLSYLGTYPRRVNRTELGAGNPEEPDVSVNSMFALLYEMLSLQSVAR